MRFHGVRASIYLLLGHPPTGQIADRVPKCWNAEMRFPGGLVGPLCMTECTDCPDESVAAIDKRATHF